jgi:hypothetical protein
MFVGNRLSIERERNEKRSKKKSHAAVSSKRRRKQVNASLGMRYAANYGFHTVLLH